MDCLLSYIIQILIFLYYLSQFLSSLGWELNNDADEFGMNWYKITIIRFSVT